MEFLDKFVIPQSMEHIELLHYLAALILIIFIPFISIVFGSTLLSLFFGRKGKKEGNKRYTYFAKDLVSMLTVNKNVGIVLGIFPIITIMIIYAQLLHTASSLSVTYLFFASILIIIALIFIYTYRYSINVSIVLTSIDDTKSDENLSNDINKLSNSTRKLSVSSGIYGIILLVLAIWLYLSGLYLALYPEQTEALNITSVLFSFDVISRLLFFLTFAMAITGGAILFRFLYWEGGVKGLDEEYMIFIRKVGIKTAFYFLALVPLFLVLNLQALPSTTLSTSIFIYSGLFLLGLFVCYNLLYLLTTSERSKNVVGALFILLIVSMGFSLVKDQIAMNNATKLQTLKLSKKYEAKMASLAGDTAPKATEINGEEIFKIRCASCHSFENRIVGPPYNETLPKYEGKTDALVSFLLKPKKINPEYPPMPNTGLKPDEAKAVAKYILNTYKK